MNILICDDEYNYIAEIKSVTENFFKENSMSVSFDTFTDGTTALNSDLGHYDIAFLDIEIGNVKGTRIAEKIKLQNPHTLFFFITAYEHYLDDAMNLFAFRFLTKPLDTNRLLNGLKTATKLIDKTDVEFLVRDGETLYKTRSSDVIFVEITGRFTKVVTTKGEYFSTNTIEFWQDKLSSTNFYRVHKSFIVNLNFITKYTRDEIELDYKYRIPVSYRIRTSFKQYYLQKVEELQK